MASHRGRHCRPSKTPQIASAVAVSGVAAGIMLTSSPAQARPLPADSSPASQVTADSMTHLRSYQLHRAAEPATVTVKPGGSLSQIARDNCGNVSDWTGIYKANKSKVHDPNLVFPGEQLVLDCKQAPYTPPARPAVQVTDQVQQSAPRSTGYSGSVNPASYSGFQQCVITRESGGNSQVMNSSGHYGLYQFSESTWEAYGGSAADFGHASVAEQNRVFANAMAQGGEYNWSPYDGC